MSGLREVTGVLEAAIFELGLAGTSDDAVDETAFDPDLWAHVQSDVQNEEWQKVASQTAIFVEIVYGSGLAVRREGATRRW